MHQSSLAMTIIDSRKVEVLQQISLPWSFKMIDRKNFLSGIVGKISVLMGGAVALTSSQAVALPPTSAHDGSTVMNVELSSC